ncbi:MAG: hypothetical protein ACRBFS_20785 [Aureispira sp.]
MASSLELFEVIKSLTSNEKRHFQLSTSLQNGKKNYVLLFEEMDAQEEYNKAQILEKLAEYKFVKSLHVTENYLYKRIMESLRAFHADKYVTTKLYKLLTDAEILNRKGFYKLSMEVLNRAEKLALKHHKSLILAEIAPRKIELIVADREKHLTEQLEELYEQSQGVCHQLQEESTYVYWHHWLVLVFRKWRDPKDPVVLQKMEAIFQSVTQSAFPEQGTFQTQCYYYTIQTLYYQLTKQYEVGNVIHAKILALWEDHPNMIKEQLSVYMARLANYINSSLTCQKGALVYVLIEKMEGLKVTTFDEAGEQFQNVYFYKQLHYLNAQQLEEAEALIPAIKDGLEKYASKINPARRLAFYYNSTITYFLLEDYQAAADWLNKILTITKTHEPRKDIQRFARILQMAIYYKLSSYEVLEYLFRSVYRNKKLKEAMHTFEKVTLDYFKQLLKTPANSNAEKALFRSFQEELEQLTEAEQQVTGFEEFFIWVTRMCR